MGQRDWKILERLYKFSSNDASFKEQTEFLIGFGRKIEIQALFSKKENSFFLSRVYLTKKMANRKYLHHLHC
jgi:DNA topoisomerase VI subunit A